MRRENIRWRFHGWPIAHAFVKRDMLFVSLCGREPSRKKIGGPEGRDGKPPPSLQRCPLCDSRFER